MAISTVPKITGPDYGGTIYGLNLQMGYSSAPSKLTIDIISANGTYKTPRLGDSVSVIFSSFKFTGIVWAWSIKENAQEKTLQIEIVDNSIILDKYHILLWKRGIFNNLGNKPIQINKTIDLSDETVILPIRDSFGSVTFQEKKLGKQTVVRNVYSQNSRNGNIIFIGTEDFPNTKCDIPDTYYILDDLKTALKNAMNITIDMVAPTNYKGTHEGKVREVLQSWAADCGYDFYWDFSTNKIMFYPVNAGIKLDLSDVSSKNLIEKSESSSMEGTFQQYALAYTAYPKEPIKVQNGDAQIAYTVSINPFPISYFLKRNGTLQSLGLPKEEEGTSEDPSAAETNLWGGRTEDSFLAAAFLGYIDESIRDLYMAQYLQFNSLGFTPVSTTGQGEAKELTTQEKESILGYLSSTVPNDIKELEDSIDTKGLPNYAFYIGIKNDDLNSKWKKIEQEILMSYGSVYRHNTGSPGTSFMCSKTNVTEITTSVDPTPNENEPQSSDFEGLKIFRRSGTMSHDQGQASSLLSLNLPENAEKLRKVVLREFDITSSTVKEKIFPKTTATHLLMIPKTVITKKFLKDLKCEIATAANPLETLWSDNSNDSSGSTNKCSPFDEAVKAGQCQDARSEAMEKEFKALGVAGYDGKDDPKNLKSGLNARTCKAAKIELFGKKLQLCAPAYGTYTVVYNINFSTQFISNFQDPQKIFFNGSGGSVSNNVAQIDVIFDNVTSSDDQYGKKRIDALPLASSISNTSPQVNRTYVFAGEPQGLTMTPSNGLSSIDISYSSDGFKTTVTYSSRPPLRTPVDTFLRKIQSQLNRKSFAAT